MATHSSVLAWRIPGTGAWWAAVYGAARSWTWLKWLSSSSMLRKIKCFELMVSLVVDSISVKSDIFKIKSLYEFAISFHLLNTSQLHPLFSMSCLLIARVTASPKGSTEYITKPHLFFKTFYCHLLGESAILTMYYSPRIIWEWHYLNKGSWGSVKLHESFQHDLRCKPPWLVLVIITPTVCYPSGAAKSSAHELCSSKMFFKHYFELLLDSMKSCGNKTEFPWVPDSPERVLVL